MTRQSSIHYQSKPRRKRMTPEACLHVTVAEHLRLAATPGTWFLHIANEGKRTPAEGAHLKRLGMMPGAADLMIVSPAGVFWLELKAKGQKPTPEQFVFGELVIGSGHEWAWADNIGDALTQLRRWSLLKRDIFEKAA